MRFVLAAAAAAALSSAAPAPAHLLGHKKSNTLRATIFHQERNLAHAKYVCTHGSGKVKYWHCLAARWVARELEESRAKLIPAVPYGKWACIHGKEGAWDANTGNGYYGGLQMDLNFQRSYGSDFMRRWGTADNWPAWAQIIAAERAYRERGFSPWPNTARACGLL